MSSEKQTTTLYRIENPNIPSSPDGVTSHEDLVGAWFAENPQYVVNYLKKATQRGQHIVPGAQLVQVEIPSDQLESLRAVNHPVAQDMDIEPDNYIVNRANFPAHTEQLDPITGDLHGQLGRLDKLQEARRRIQNHLAETALK